MPDASGASAAGGMRSTAKGQRKRPIYKNIGVSEILHYRLPPAGIVSILHRVSGALLFLIGIPFALYLLQLSLTSAPAYARFEAIMSGVLPRLLALAMFWAFFHHLCAGIRYLVLDLHLGLEKEQAQLSAKIAAGAGVLLTAIAALKLFGAV